MTPGVTRRQALRTITAGVAGSALVGRVRAAEATLTGRIVAEDGDPVAGRRVYIAGVGYHDTDSNGRFRAEVEANSRKSVALYKSTPGQLIAPERNQVPHIYELGRYRTGSGETDIGTIDVPRAYLVRARVLDEDGNPVQGAEPHFYSGGFGSGHYGISTDSDGLMRIKGANFDGIELADQSGIHIHIPIEGGGKMQYEALLNVDGPKALLFRVGEGVTVYDGTEFPGSSGASSTASPTPTASPTATSSPTPTSQPATTSTQTSSQATASPASTQSPSTPGETPTRTAVPVKRGFFSNSPEPGELEFLSDPLFLTVGGFVLSAAGIVHQLLRGQ